MVQLKKKPKKEPWMEFSSGFLTEQMAKASILSTKKKGQLSATLPQD